MVERGNLTVWLSPDAIAQWNAKPSRQGAGAKTQLTADRSRERPDSHPNRVRSRHSKFGHAVEDVACEPSHRWARSAQAADYSLVIDESELANSMQNVLGAICG
ncbi:MAG: hypothetical protein ACI8UD_003754 [Planctomycetota bacterium]